MQVTLLGTGGPRPDPDRQAPATLVQVAGLNLVFDAGRGVATQLAKAGVRTGDISAIFITHHHYDHIGGLGDLLMAAWNNMRDRPLPIYGPTGTAEIISALFEGVYWRDIAYRIAEEKKLGVVLDPPDVMVEVHEVMTGVVAVGPGVRVTVGEVEHGATVLDLPRDDWATVGYRVSAEHKHVAISGDAVAGRDLASLAEGVDLLVMCAYLAATEIDSAATRYLTEAVIAGAPQAAAIATEAGAHALALTHIREKPPDEIEQMRRQVAAPYDGTVIVGEDMMVIAV